MLERVFAEYVKLNREIPKQIEFPNRSISVWHTKHKHQRIPVRMVHSRRLRVERMACQDCRNSTSPQQYKAVYGFVCAERLPAAPHARNHIHTTSGGYRIFPCSVHYLISAWEAKHIYRGNNNLPSSSSSSSKRIIENWYALAPKNPSHIRFHANNIARGHREQNQYT